MSIIYIDPYQFAAAGYDPDAQTYITAVEAADGQALEVAVKDAVNDFVVGCKDDGIWDAIKESCIIGRAARTLNGALVPLKGGAPTNIDSAFVEADYDRKLGLQGSKSPPKSLRSTRVSNDDPQNNHHMSAYITTQGTMTSSNFIIICRNGTSSTNDINDIVWANSTLITRSRSSTAFSSGVVTGLGESFLGISRTSSTEFQTRYYGTTVTTGSVSNTPGTQTYLIFGPYNANNMNGKIAFYSIGESLDLALLDARVSTLMSDLAAAIP